MDTENKNIELEDQISLFENEEVDNETISSEAKDELKDAIEETISNIRRQSMLLGAQAICQTILDKIYAFESSRSKKSANDYKRCLKSLKEFCAVGLSRKVNADGETETSEETAQN